MNDDNLTSTLRTQTRELTQLVTELAEVEVAEHQAFIHGYIHSQSPTETGRKRDGDYAAMDFAAERTRLRARVEVARLERETTLTLLALPPDPSASP